jgi:hypothetical protein
VDKERQRGIITNDRCIGKIKRVKEYNLNVNKENERE